MTRKNHESYVIHNLKIRKVSQSRITNEQNAPSSSRLARFALIIISWPTYLCQYIVAVHHRWVGEYGAAVG